MCDFEPLGESPLDGFLKPEEIALIQLEQRRAAMAGKFGMHVMRQRIREKCESSINNSTIHNPTSESPTLDLPQIVSEGSSSKNKVPLSSLEPYLKARSTKGLDDTSTEQLNQ